MKEKDSPGVMMSVYFELFVQQKNRNCEQIITESFMKMFKQIDLFNLFNEMNVNGF